MFLGCTCWCHWRSSDSVRNWPTSCSLLSKRYWIYYHQRKHHLHRVSSVANVQALTPSVILLKYELKQHQWYTVLSKKKLPGSSWKGRRTALSKATTPEKKKKCLSLYSCCKLLHDVNSFCMCQARGKTDCSVQ